MTIVIRHNSAVGTGQNTGETAHALILIHLDNSVLDRKSACNAALYAQRLLAVTALYRKGYTVFLLDLDPRIYFNVFQSLDHIVLARVGICAVILAQVTAKTPLFIYINSFHTTTQPHSQLNVHL